jgi:carbon-monoxide dehydrogenase medium subunit
MPDLPAFTYSRPRDLAAAMTAIGRRGACVYAGGTDLLVALAERRPWVRFVRELVDVKGISEGKGLRERGARLRIGALTTADELAAHPLVRRHARVLAEAAEQTSAPALRRRGTLGGNVSSPHPAGDVTTALLALDAMVEVADRKAVCEVPLVDFMRTQAEGWPRQRLILAVTVCKCRRSAFEKVGARPAFSRSLVAVGVAAIDGALRIALGGLRERPFPSPAVAASVARGEGLETALAAECRPPTDALASDAYRLRLAATLLRRAVARAGLR